MQRISIFSNFDKEAMPSAIFLTISAKSSLLSSGKSKPGVRLISRILGYCFVFLNFLLQTQHQYQKTSLFSVNIISTAKKSKHAIDVLCLNLLFKIKSEFAFEQ